MSTRKYDRIVYGWKLIKPVIDNIDINDEKYDFYIGNENIDFAIYPDYHNDNYIVFGQNVLTARYDVDYNFDDLKIEKLNSDMVKSKLKKILGIDNVSEPTLFIFTEYL